MAAYPSLDEFALGLEHDDVPAHGRRLAVDAITDCVACILAGYGTELRDPLLAVVSGPGMQGGAALIGAGRPASLHDAALYHGALGHALDYDDGSHPAYAHPSTVLVPALLSAASAADASGRDFVTAYVVGLEVLGRLGRALNLQHYKNGWHATSTLGTIAAAAAVGRMLRLSSQQMRMAVGMAASASSGVRANFGTMTKPLHAGYAARNGVLAATLARQGFTASPDALAHRVGFVNTFNQTGGVDPSQLQTWGGTLEIVTEFGIALKLFPSCAATHPAIEAALTLHRRLQDPVREIARVRVGACEIALEPLIYKEAKTPLQGKFSMHYCVSSALLDGAVRLATFTEEKVARKEVQDLVAKTVMEVDERVRHDKEFAAVVTVETVDGRKLEELVHLAPGKPCRWFTPQQMHEKFMDCHAASGLQLDAGGLFRKLQAMDGDAPMSAILAALAG
jgi:2-methylcitrate dehydratase PrpD